MNFAINTKHALVGSSIIIYCMFCVLCRIFYWCFLLYSSVVKDLPKGFPSWLEQDDLSDIIIESEDGKLFNCHKCILYARLGEFCFNSMPLAGV